MNEETVLQKTDYKLNKIGDQTSAIHILLLLDEYGDLYFSQFIKLGINQTTFGKAKKILIEMDLIERYDVDMGQTSRVYHKLTNQGKNIALKLKEIETII